LFWAHKLHFSHTVLLRLESLGTKKCWAKVVLRAVCPEWLPLWNCLTNVGASDSRIAIWGSANFYHLPCRRFHSLV
jgi:hypothetical protein